MRPKTHSGLEPISCRKLLEPISCQTGKLMVQVTHRQVTVRKNLVAHTGLEPVISALRGQRVNQLHQCAAVGLWGL